MYLDGIYNFYNILHNGEIYNVVFYFIDDDDIYNSPNFHLEMQDDDLEIPNGKVFKKLKKFIK